MTLERAQEVAPTLFARLENQVFTSRELVVVDDNYKEDDGEEVAEFDPDAYNYLIYIAEPTQKILREEGMSQLVKKLEGYERFEDFLLSEEDFFGVQSQMGQKELAEVVLQMVEEIIA